MNTAGDPYTSYGAGIFFDMALEPTSPNEEVMKTALEEVKNISRPFKDKINNNNFAIIWHQEVHCAHAHS